MTTITVPYAYDKVNDRYVEGHPMSFRTILAFDYDGNLVERAVYSDGELSLKTRLEYNEQGFMTRKSSSGRLIGGEKIVALSEDDFVDEKVQDPYLSSVTESEAIGTDGRKSLVKMVRTFDAHGWLAEEAIYFNDKLG